MKLKNIKEKLERLKKVLPDEHLSSRIDVVLRVLLVGIVLAIFWGNADRVFHIPVNKPYFDGEWDEPFAINAGINILKTKGDPVFYNYGGTTSYTHALIFYLYCRDKQIIPYYQEMDSKYKNPHWPIYRKIYPVKPIYIAKVMSYMLFMVGAFLYVGLFSVLLLPVVFWLVPSIISGQMMQYMAPQMLPETHLVLLAGLTALFFIKAILEKKTPHYFKWLILCAVSASFTVAAKINAAYIILLPVSLLWRPVKEKFIDLKRAGMFLAGLIVPYILVNPAIIFNFNRYKDWLLEMNRLSGTTPGIWTDRMNQVNSVLEDLYLYKLFPAVLLIVLFILACILMIKKNPAAFAGLMFFFLYSLFTITNMKHNFYGRHLVVLILPFQLFILFPLIYYFSSMSKQGKAFVTLVCLVVTLWIYPPQQTVQRIMEMRGKSFTNHWKRESRDELADFVKANNAVLYFYDFHGFSLPNTIHNRIIPFTHPAQLPAELKLNEYVAFIRYRKAEKGVFNPILKYNAGVERILEQFETVKTFGIQGGSHDINDQSPLGNPTIELLKRRIGDGG